VISWLLISFVLVSFLLSITILARFFLPLNQNIQLANYLLYCIFFLVLPGIAVFYLMLKVDKLKLSRRWQLLSWYVAIIWLTVFALDVFQVPSYEYLYIWIIVPLVYFLSNSWNKDRVQRQKSKRMKLLVVTCLLIAIIMPNLVTIIGSTQLVANVSQMPLQDKVSYIDERVNSLTEYTWVFRSQWDNWKFLISGAGQCGEMATATNNFIHSASLTSRIVDIPGEHDFVEVWVNGKWMVADGSNLVNQTSYGRIRTDSVGSLSYALTMSAGSFIELTQEYVPTDTIIINVTRNSQPIANIPITLVRTGALSATIPSSDRPFYTNADGIVTLHLGAARFIDAYEKTTNYYIIYANGQPTPYNVTSTGSGLTTEVFVDI
jgi:hypothetical protein